MLVSPILLLGVVSFQDLRGEIEVSARALAVSPAGDLWIGSRDGRLYVSRDWNGSWSEVDAGTRADGDLGTEESLDHVRFFDADHGILAGFVGKETKNEILRTTDGGRTWARVSLGVRNGMPVWIAAVQVSADGHAWMAGSTGVLVSMDFGATWHYADGEPFEAAVRCRSISFRTPDIGVVGADGNALSRTTDGGRTWSMLCTPIDELYPADARVPESPEMRGEIELDVEEGWERERDRRVEGVWCLGERLLVLQRRRLFHRPLDGNGAWTAIDVRGHEVVAAELESERLLVVTDDLRISWLSSGLQVTSACAVPLDGRPFALATGARGAAFLTDVTGRVCTLVNELACSRLHTRDDERQWPIGSFDRTVDGMLFGVSTSALYRSRDSGRSWERLAEGRNLAGVSASADGDHAVVLTYDQPQIWRGGSELIPMAFDARKLHSFKIHERRGPLWVATAFEAAEDESTQWLLRTTDTTEVGPGFVALVFTSTDEGLSWKTAAECSGAVVDAVWFGDDGALRLCLSDDTIRAGTIDPRDGALRAGEPEILAKVKGICGDWGHWLAFLDARIGWAGGRFFFEGASLMQTSDGGRTWSELDAETVWMEAFRLGSGACARIVHPWRDANRVELLKHGEFRELRSFESAVHDARVDAGGSLLVRLEDGEVWSLAPDGVAWSRLGTIQLPPR